MRRRGFLGAILGLPAARGGVRKSDPPASELPGGWINGKYYGGSGRTTFRPDDKAGLTISWRRCEGKQLRGTLVLANGKIVAWCGRDGSSFEVTAEQLRHGLYFVSVS